MLKNYVKVALKVFRRHKFLTGVNLFGICFTLVVLMVATASIDQEVGPIPPEIHSDRTLYLDWLFPKFTATDSSPSPEKAVLRTYRPGYAFLDRYVRPLETAEKVTVFSHSDPRGMQGGAEESHLKVMLTDGTFWDVFRFDFRQGRPYGTEEVASGARVAVIRAGFSRGFFGSEEVVGKSVPIDGENYRVVGVVTDVRHNYFYRERGMRVHADVWVPVTTAPAEVWRTYRLSGQFRAAVLARRPADMKRIRAEFAAVLEQVEPPPDERFALTGVSAPLVTKLEEWGLRGRWKKDYRSSADGRQVVADYLQRRVLTLGGYMLLFLLLPALHLVNLSIGRIEERTSEIGVRKSFGASTRILAGQFVAENVLLTLIGGALSLPLSWGILALDQNVYMDVGVLIRTYFYGVLLALFFGVISGAWPAWKMARLHPVQALTGRVE